MVKISKAKYSQEYRVEAVKLVLEQGLSVIESAKRLNIPSQTLATWVKVAKACKVGRVSSPNAEAIEIARLKRALAIAEMERDILKKATAYFARESVQGTRL